MSARGVANIFIMIALLFNGATYARGSTALAMVETGTENLSGVYATLTSLYRSVSRRLSQTLGLSGYEHGLLEADSSAHHCSAASRPDRLLIIVHGYAPVVGQFAALIEESKGTEVHVLQFHYDHHHALDEVALDLASAVAGAANCIKPRQIEVLGHSLGGLVARRAVEHLATKELGAGVTLMTIAAPFHGFASAAGTVTMPVDIGLSESHRDIAALSAFIREPKRLPAGIQHCKLETDEMNADVADLPHDHVLRLEDQVNPRVDNDPRLVLRRVVAVGHISAIGARGNVPAAVREFLAACRQATASGP